MSGCVDAFVALLCVRFCRRVRFSPRRRRRLAASTSTRARKNVERVVVVVRFACRRSGAQRYETVRVVIPHVRLSSHAPLGQGNLVRGACGVALAGVASELLLLLLLPFVRTRDKECGLAYYVSSHLWQFLSATTSYMHVPLFLEASGILSCDE